MADGPVDTREEAALRAEVARLKRALAEAYLQLDWGASHHRKVVGDLQGELAELRGTVCRVVALGLGYPACCANDQTAEQSVAWGHLAALVEGELTEARAVLRQPELVPRKGETP